MLCPPHPPSPLVEQWLARHRDPGSFVLHLIGIPPTVLALVLIPYYVYLLSLSIFLFSMSLFVGGYLIQFLGHALEGTVPGELMIVRRWMARPAYVKVAPPRTTPGSVA